MSELNTVYGRKKEWASSGVLKKPSSCDVCPLREKHSGFVYDLIPETAKVLFVFSAPRPDDTVEQKPAGGNMGRRYRYEFIHSLGREASDVAFVNVLRCAPPFFKNQFAYPTGATRTRAEATCRQYDTVSSEKGVLIPGGVTGWNPDLFLLTFEPDAIRNGPAFVHLIKEDCRKAFRLSDKGFRVAVLFGREPGEMFAPFAFAEGAGGLKSWRGHFFKASWKPLNLLLPEQGKKRGFIGTNW